MEFLTPTQVVRIRRLHEAGYSIRAIARGMRKADSVIAGVVHRRTYTNVTDVQPEPLIDPGPMRHTRASTFEHTMQCKARERQGRGHAECKCSCHPHGRQG